MLLPTPAKVISGREFSFGRVPSVNFTLLKGELDISAFSLVLGVFAEGGDVSIQAFRASQKELTYIPPAKRLSGEVYKLLISEKGGSVHIQIHCSARAGFLHALFTIKKMIDSDSFIIGEILDYPLFPVRGYIEGFYGKPWTHSQRLEMLHLVAESGNNTYYYAPKDDMYQRKFWRALYPAKERHELENLINTAQSLCITLCCCVSPGLSIRYSDDEDVKALCKKAAQLYSLGVRSFGLLLDDIPEKLFYKEDADKYGETVNAHIDLINRYYSFLISLDKSNRLTVCPLQYFGAGNEYYVSRLCSAIPPEVDVFFTGSDICSSRITVREAALFRETNHRRVLYWDNFPVNDAEMFKEMHLSPLIGREKTLYTEAKGIISNAMEYCECSKAPLITCAAYLWNPLKYEPESAFDAALARILPPEEIPDIKLLCDHLRTSCLKDENSALMGRIFSEANVLSETGRQAQALKMISEYAASVRRASLRLNSRHGGIYEELTEWINKFTAMSHLLDMALDYLTNALGDRSEKKAAILQGMKEYNNCATVLTSFSFREFMESVTGQ